MTTLAQRATLVVNPAARGVVRRLDPERALAYLRRRGLEVELAVPASAADLSRVAEEAAGHADDLLFVAGGDGSMRDAARGLAGSKTALAPLPAGTVNIFARECGLPRGIRAALDAHLTGETRRMDVGRANGEPFLLMASAGWDAAVARGVSLALKRRLGDLAYGIEAARQLPRLRTMIARWEVDGVGREGPLALIVIGNTRLYGGRVRFSPLALADDGALDVVALCPRASGDGLRLAWRLLRGRVAADANAFASRATNVAVPTPGLPIQLDGDYAGETPASFAVDPGALLVSLPRGLPAPIFSV